MYSANYMFPPIHSVMSESTGLLSISHQVYISLHRPKGSFIIKKYFKGGCLCIFFFYAGAINFLSQLSKGINFI